MLPVIVGNVSNAKWLRKRGAIDASSSIMLSQRSKLEYADWRRAPQKTELKSE